MLTLEKTPAPVYVAHAGATMATAADAMRRLTLADYARHFDAKRAAAGKDPIGLALGRIREIVETNRATRAETFARLREQEAAAHLEFFNAYAATRRPGRTSRAALERIERAKEAQAARRADLAAFLFPRASRGDGWTEADHEAMDKIARDVVHLGCSVGWKPPTFAVETRTAIEYAAILRRYGLAPASLD